MKRRERDAGPELLVLAKWEELTGWLLDHTNRWPKSVRFTLSQRVQNHVLDIVELLVVARYDRAARPENLREVNLRLERLRFLFRLARRAKVSPSRGFEAAMRGLDETGRMIHGWRKSLRVG
ncbi:MAG: diversity-generating retroelement protein Avd [Planctomycetota bacterium]